MIYFASDFHLGIPDERTSRAREKSICNWLENISKDATEVFLLGDVFDFWFEYKNAVPKGFVRLLGTLARLTDQGIKVYLFKGNHDMWLFGYLKEECGVEIVSDEMVLERNSKKFFLHHGDGLGERQFAYKAIRYIFRSAVCQWLFARIHPNTGIGIARYLSRRSRNNQKGIYDHYLGDDSEVLTAFCKKQLEQGHIDYFIFGHRHLVLNINLGEGSRYINLGDWFNGRQYAKFDGKDLEIIILEPPDAKN